MYVGIVHGSSGVATTTTTTTNIWQMVKATFKKIYMIDRLQKMVYSFILSVENVKISTYIKHINCS